MKSITPIFCAKFLLKCRSLSHPRIKFAYQFNSLGIFPESGTLHDSLTPPGGWGARLCAFLRDDINSGSGGVRLLSNRPTINGHIDVKEAQ